MQRLTILLVLTTICNAGLLNHLTRNRRDVQRHDLQIRDLTARSAQPYPQVLHLQVRTPHGETQTLRLKRNPQFYADIPVTVIKNRVKKRHEYTDDRAEYVSERSVFHVRAAPHNDRYERSFTGMLDINNEKYFIEREADSNEHAAVKLPPVTEFKHGSERGDPIDVILKGRPRRTKYSWDRSRKPVNYTLSPDILVVVDYGIYKKFGGNAAAVEQIRNYYGVIMAGVAHRYSQVNYKTMTITPRLARIDILTTEKDDRDALGDYKQDDTINARSALADIASHYDPPEDRMKNMDHAMVFTSHDLYTINAENHINYWVYGMAYIEKICDYEGVSLIEDDLSLRAIGTAAHELGHSLGARHDSGACDNDYIMDPKFTYGNDQTFHNQYKLSKCSLEDIYKNVQIIHRFHNCMTDSPALEEQMGLDRLPGTLYRRNTQCQRYTKNQGARHCGPRNTCRHLTCRVPGGDCRAVWGRHALHGTHCGRNKHCMKGVCVQKS